MNQETSIRSRFIRGSGFILVSTWVKRVLGIVSLFVLARFLSPSDYGIVAVGALVLRFFEVLTETGTNQYILSRAKLEKNDINTAWTLKLITRVFVSFMLIVLSPFLSQFFENEELIYVFLALAIVPILNGLESPSIILLSRQLYYGKLAICGVISKAVSFIFALYVAVVYQNYWALVLADIIFALVMLILSYVIAKDIPRLSLVNWQKQWDYSKWLLYKSITGYTRAKFDVLLISKLFSSFDFGLYSMAKQLVFLPHTMIAEPISNSMLTLINDKKSDVTETRNLLTVLMTVMFTVMLPVIIFVILYSPLIIPKLLGDQWVGAIVLIQIMIVLSLLEAINSVIVSAMNALQMVKVIFQINFITLMLTAALLLLLYKSALTQFALWQIVLASITLVFFFFIIARKLDIRILNILIAFFPAMLASTICCLIAYFAHPNIIDLIDVGMFLPILICTYLICVWLFSVILSKYSETTEYLVFVFGEYVEKRR